MKFAGFVKQLLTNVLAYNDIYFSSVFWAESESTKKKYHFTNVKKIVLQIFPGQLAGHKIDKGRAEREWYNKWQCRD